MYVRVNKNFRVSDPVVLDHSPDNILDSALSRDCKPLSELCIEMLAHILGEDARKLLENFAKLAISLRIKVHLVVSPNLQIRANDLCFKFLFNYNSLDRELEFKAFNFKKADAPFLLCFGRLKL